MQPLTPREYEERTRQNIEYFGHGVNAGAHIPCPFCGAPRFMSYRIIECMAEMQKEHICTECSRGARTIITTSPDGLTTGLEIVQTCGDDPPEWIKNWIRRL